MIVWLWENWRVTDWRRVSSRRSSSGSKAAMVEKSRADPSFCLLHDSRSAHAQAITCIEIVNSGDNFHVYTAGNDLCLRIWVVTRSHCTCVHSITLSKNIVSISCLAVAALLIWAQVGMQHLMATTGSKARKHRFEETRAPAEASHATRFLGARRLPESITCRYGRPGRPSSRLSKQAFRDMPLKSRKYVLGRTAVGLS